MFDNILKFLKKMIKKEDKTSNSKDAAKERLHLVLLQDRANVSADFLDLMKQEIIEVIKKYIEIDESAIDVRLTNKENDDGTNGAPALYANIPIVNIKDETRKMAKKEENPENEETIKEDKENNNEKEEAHLKDENKENEQNDDGKKSKKQDEKKKAVDLKEENNKKEKEDNKTIETESEQIKLEEISNENENDNINKPE